MKKLFFVSLLALMVAFSFGCGKSERAQKNEAADTTSSHPGHRTEKAEPELPADTVYRNKECGYSFEFPESWQGYYFVNDKNPAIAIVRFYGKSVAGTTFEKESFGGDYGLTMFFILSHDEAQTGFYDNVTKLGTAGGEDYYFATTTDVSIAPLIEDRYFGDMTDRERAKWQSDNKKIMEMSKFYSYENRHNLALAFKGDSK